MNPEPAALAPVKVGTVPLRRAGGLTRRASLTAIAALLDYGVRLMVGVVITPVVVTHLGSSLFGIWEMLSRLIGYLSAADGRPMDALRLVLANQQATADDAANRRTVGSALGVWVLLLPVAIVASAGLIWISPTLAHATPEQVGTIRLATALLAGNFILTTLVALPEAALFGTNQGYRRMGIAAALQVAGGFVILAVLRAGFGLVALAAVQVVLTMLTAALYLAVARKHIPWFGVERPAAGEVRRFASLSGWSLAGDSIAKLMLASDVLILGFLMSSAAVTSYVLTGYSTQAVIGILTLAIGAALPGLANVIGLGDLGRARALRAELLAFGWLAGTAIGTVILLWNQAFLDIWVGPGHYAGEWSNALLVVMMIQTILIRADASVINAALRIRARVVVSGLAAVFSCAAALVLVPRGGIPGLCLSLIIGRSIQTIGFPLIVNNSLGLGRSAGWHASLRPLLSTVVLFVGASLVGRQLVGTTWAGWVTGVVGSLPVALAAAIFMGLPRDSRRVVMVRLRMLPYLVRA